MLQRLFKFDFKKKKSISSADVFQSKDELNDISSSLLGADPPHEQKFSESGLILQEIKDDIEKLDQDKRLISFSILELATRSKNIFNRENIATPNDFFKVDNETILKWPGLGKRSLKDIKDAIRQLSNDDGHLQLAHKQEELDIALPEDNSWLERYLSENPRTQSLFEQHGISSFQDFEDKMDALSPDEIMEVENFRFCHAAKNADYDDPISLLKVCPKWLLEMETFYFECDKRLKNVISGQKIIQMKDLLRFSSSELLRLPNTGRKSMRNLSEAILSAQNKGPPPTPENPETSCSSLIEGFTISLKKIDDDNHRQIIEGRLGVKGHFKTLEELAQELGITRERVRQIQNTVIDKIIDGEFWDDTLRFKIEKLIDNPHAPIIVDEMEKVDPWFSGFNENPRMLQKIIESFSHLEPKFLNVDDKIIMTSLDNEKWESIRGSLLDNFEYSLDMQYTLEDLELLVESELIKAGTPELSGLMFEAIYPSLNFSFVSGDFILVSIGNSIGSHLKAILEESSVPLHYTDVRDKYEEKFGVNLSERNVHARLSYKNFLLYDRGTFGTEKHYPLSDSEEKNIILFVEEKVKSDDKQWHTDELLKLLKKERPDLVSDKLDKYVLNIALGHAPSLIYLGKMVWIDSASETDAERLNISQVVANILLNQGRPLRVEEIEKEILKVRSVGSNFSTNLQPNSLFSRLDPATWGLLDRDFVLSSQEWEIIKEQLFEKLERSNQALHTSELTEYLQSIDVPTGVNSGHLIGVLLVDDRFRKWRGGLIGLSKWSEPNRLSLSDALDQIIPSDADRIEISEIDGNLRETLGYSFDRNRISIHLNKRGFVFNREQNIWKKAA